MLEIKKLIRDNAHPVNILLIGAGGTGSQLLQSLSRINTSLLKLDKAGFIVTLIDDDVITQSNIGRQLFSTAELGMYKTEVLINRINRFFGSQWVYFAKRFTKDFPIHYDIVITCCDNVETRKILSKKLKRIGKQCGVYWIDCGNTKNTGQIWFSSVADKIPDIFDEFGDIQEDMDTPSCSLAEALEKQDLFINTLVADFCGQMIWSLFRNVLFYTQAYFINLHPHFGPTIKTKLLK